MISFPSTTRVVPSQTCVKHLNPRQGITTKIETPLTRPTGSWCETPKSPPGDYNKKLVCAPRALSSSQCETPKSPPGDYNSDSGRERDASIIGVKHLNPRQGITTYSRCCRRNFEFRTRVCETPKSPPGDYNLFAFAAPHLGAVVVCETPKSPPGDDNSRMFP